MKVSPLETTNKFNILTMKETQDECFLKPKPNCIWVIYYVSKFISKLQHATLWSWKSKNKHASKMIKWLICSAKIEKEIMLKVGLRTIDSHEIEEVDMLLDSGATGLFIDCAWLRQKKISIKNWSTQSKSTISTEVLIEEEVSLRRLLSYYHTKDTRNMLCSRCVIWENLILSLVT